MVVAYPPFYPQQILDADGKPVAGGVIRAYYTGSEVPAPLFAPDGTPLGSSVSIDAAGNAVLCLRVGTIYRLRCFDADGAAVWTRDGVVVLGTMPINPMTAPGDLIVGGPDGQMDNLPAGGVGKALKIAPNGIPDWLDDIGFDNPLTALGQILVGGTDGAPAALSAPSTPDLMLWSVSLGVGKNVPAWRDPTQKLVPLAGTAAGYPITGDLEQTQSGQTTTRTAGGTSSTGPLVVSGDSVTASANVDVVAQANGKIGFKADKVSDVFQTTVELGPSGVSVVSGAVIFAYATGNVSVSSGGSVSATAAGNMSITASGGTMRIAANGGPINIDSTVGAPITTTVTGDATHKTQTAQNVGGFAVTVTGASSPTSLQLSGNDGAGTSALSGSARDITLLAAAAAGDSSPSFSAGAVNGAAILSGASIGLIAAPYGSVNLGSTGLQVVFPTLPAQFSVSALQLPVYARAYDSAKSYEFLARDTTDGYIDKLTPAEVAALIGGGGGVNTFVKWTQEFVGATGTTSMSTTQSIVLKCYADTDMIPEEVVLPCDHQYANTTYKAFIVVGTETFSSSTVSFSGSVTITTPSTTPPRVAHIPLTEKNGFTKIEEGKTYFLVFGKSAGGTSEYFKQDYGVTLYHARTYAGAITETPNWAWNNATAQTGLPIVGLKFKRA